MNEQQFDSLLHAMGAIERHLGILAAYVAELHQERSGEKVYEVGAWVRSVTSQGDDCAYLYATHPGLQYRVCTVYVERLHELPFAIDAAKVYDGEAAPTREGAAKRGYLNACDPFRVALKPTGKETDNGHPIYRFDRILDGVPAAPIAAPAARNGAGAALQAANGKQVDLVQRFIALADKLNIPNDERGRLVASVKGDYARAIAGLERRQGASGRAAGGAGDDIDRWPHPLEEVDHSADAAIRARLNRMTGDKSASFPGTATVPQYGLWCGLAEDVLGSAEDRRLVTARLAGVAPAVVTEKDWRPPAARCAAWLDWLTEPNVRPYRASAAAAGELKVVLDEARKAASQDRTTDVEEEIPF